MQWGPGDGVFGEEVNPSGLHNSIGLLVLPIGAFVGEVNPSDLHNSIDNRAVTLMSSAPSVDLNSMTENCVQLTTPSVINVASVVTMLECVTQKQSIRWRCSRVISKSSRTL